VPEKRQPVELEDEAVAVKTKPLLLRLPEALPDTGASA
jgi:hypothetical protein